MISGRLTVDRKIGLWRFPSVMADFSPRRTALTRRKRRWNEGYEGERRYERIQFHMISCFITYRSLSRQCSRAQAGINNTKDTLSQ